MNCTLIHHLPVAWAFKPSIDHVTVSLAMQEWCYLVQIYIDGEGSVHCGDLVRKNQGEEPSGSEPISPRCARSRGRAKA